MFLCDPFLVPRRDNLLWSKLTILSILFEVFKHSGYFVCQLQQSYFNQKNCIRLLIEIQTQYIEKLQKIWWFMILSFRKVFGHNILFWERFIKLGGNLFGMSRSLLFRKLQNCDKIKRNPHWNWCRRYEICLITFQRIINFASCPHLLKTRTFPLWLMSQDITNIIFATQAWRRWNKIHPSPLKCHENQINQAIALLCCLGLLKNYRSMATWPLYKEVWPVVKMHRWQYRWLATISQ